jgi:uncharacterized membrane protein (UPF0127 family)
MRRFTACSAALLVLALAGCAAAPAPQASAPAHGAAVTLTGPDGARLDVRAEVADTEAERERGLMGRASLAEGDGMLFVFDHEQPLAFWMKNTLIPLDIAYFDANGGFVSSVTMIPCERDPCATYPSARPASFALEVPAGWLARNGIGGGWSLRLPE